MGRPVEVTDEDVIAAGLRLESRGIEVKTTRLWTELGERGLPRRMFAVWTKFAAERAATSDQPAGARPLLPERARRLADGLKTQVGGELDRIVGTIHDEIQATVASRYQEEFGRMEAARIAHVSEVDEALDALGRLGEERDALRATLRHSDQTAAVAQRECDIKDQLLVTAALEQATSTELVATIRESVEIERLKNINLRLDLMRAQTLAESSGNNITMLQMELAQERLENRRLQAAASEQDATAKAFGLDLSRYQSSAAEAVAERDKAWAAGKLLEARAVKSELALEAFRSITDTTMRGRRFGLRPAKHARPVKPVRKGVRRADRSEVAVAAIPAPADELRPGGLS